MRVNSRGVFHRHRRNRLPRFQGAPLPLFAWSTATAPPFITFIPSWRLRSFIPAVWPSTTPRRWLCSEVSKIWPSSCWIVPASFDWMRRCLLAPSDSKSVWWIRPDPALQAGYRLLTAEHLRRPPLRRVAQTASPREDPHPQLRQSRNEAAKHRGLFLRAAGLS